MFYRRYLPVKDITYLTHKGEEEENALKGLSLWPITQSKFLRQQSYPQSITCGDWGLI
jgi:hypothetical protein